MKSRHELCRYIVFKCIPFFQKKKRAYCYVVVCLFIGPPTVSDHFHCKCLKVSDHFQVFVQSKCVELLRYKTFSKKINSYETFERTFSQYCLLSFI